MSRANIKYSAEVKFTLPVDSPILDQPVKEVADRGQRKPACSTTDPSPDVVSPQAHAKTSPVLQSRRNFTQLFRVPFLTSTYNSQLIWVYQRCGCVPAQMEQRPSDIYEELKDADVPLWRRLDTESLCQCLGLTRSHHHTFELQAASKSKQAAGLLFIGVLLDTLALMQKLPPRKLYGRPLVTALYQWHSPVFQEALASMKLLRPLKLIVEGLRMLYRSLSIALSIAKYKDFAPASNPVKKAVCRVLRALRSEACSDTPRGARKVVQGEVQLPASIENILLGILRGDKPCWTCAEIERVEEYAKSARWTGISCIKFFLEGDCIRLTPKGAVWCLVYLYIVSERLEDKAAEQVDEELMRQYKRRRTQSDETDETTTVSVNDISNLVCGWRSAEVVTSASGSRVGLLRRQSANTYRWAWTMVIFALLTGRRPHEITLFNASLLYTGDVVAHIDKKRRGRIATAKLPLNLINIIRRAWNLPILSTFTRPPSAVENITVFEKLMHCPPKGSYGKRQVPTFLPWGNGKLAQKGKLYFLRRANYDVAERASLAAQAAMCHSRPLIGAQHYASNDTSFIVDYMFVVLQKAFFETIGVGMETFVASLRTLFPGYKSLNFFALPANSFEPVANFTRSEDDAWLLQKDQATADIMSLQQRSELIEELSLSKRLTARLSAMLALPIDDDSDPFDEAEQSNWECYVAIYEARQPRRLTQKNS